MSLFSEPHLVQMTAAATMTGAVLGIHSHHSQKADPGGTDRDHDLVLQSNERKMNRGC